MKKSKIALALTGLASTSASASCRDTDDRSYRHLGVASISGHSPQGGGSLSHSQGPNGDGISSAIDANTGTAGHIEITGGLDPLIPDDKSGTNHLAG